MKLFDFNNPRHIEILREELSRAKRIIKEHRKTSLTEGLPNNADLYYRGIINTLRDKENRYANTAEVQSWLCNEIGASDDDLKTLAEELYEYAKQNPTAMMELRIETMKRLKERNSSSGVSASVNPYDSTSHVSKGFMGSRYTGD